jgi:ABC-type Fe3+/spermidine/putrescine transport system ATPase subunit
MEAGNAPAVEVERLRAGYGATIVVDGVDLAVAPGEFVAILGSSGCGKTTLLRTIAGFQKAASGRVRSFGRDMTDLPPERREVAMVFQSYALWPHMTVLGNIGYGLRLRGRPRAEIRARVGKILAMLNMAGLEDRKVTDLSGGQRQRVALGRALAVEPRLLLLDEPLSNLDAKVRLQLRAEIKALQSRLGFAVLHVTHDREEAMTMADRIVVMDQGRIAQVGAPEEVYHRPVSPFVATFMGADNTIALKIGEGPAGKRVEAGEHHQAAPIQDAIAVGPKIAYFRDDVARIESPARQAEGEITLQGKVTLRSYPGGHYRYAVAVGASEYMVRDARLFEVGTPVGLCLPVAALHLFPANETPN